MLSRVYFAHSNYNYCSIIIALNINKDFFWWIYLKYWLFLLYWSYRSFLLFIFVSDCYCKLFVECVFHAQLCWECVYWLSPAVFLIWCKWGIECLFCVSLVSFIKMPISMSFLVIMIWIILKLVKAMGLFERIIIFSKDRHVIWVWIRLH